MSADQTFNEHRQRSKEDWDAVAERARARWDQVSEDDIASAAGKLEALIAVIQRKTGEARDKIEAVLHDAGSKVARNLASAQQTVAEYSSEAAAELQERYGEMNDMARRRYAQAEAIVQRSPGSALAAAFGAGVVVGLAVTLAVGMRDRS